MTRDCLLSERLDERDENVSDTLVKLTELVVKNNTFNFNEKNFEKKEAHQLGQSLRHTIVFYLWQN